MNGIKDEERIYLSIYKPSKYTRIPGFSVIRAEDRVRAEEGFEENLRILKRNILRLQDITDLTPDMLEGTNGRLFLQYLKEGQEKFIYFNQFYDEWMSKTETVPRILRHTSAVTINQSIIVGIELKESNAYVRAVADLIGVATGRQLKSFDMINAHIRNRMNNKLMMDKIYDKVKGYSGDRVFLFANEYPYESDVLTIFSWFKDAKIYYTIEDRLVTVDETLMSRYVRL